MRCKYCGSEVNTSHRNCINCGAPSVSFLEEESVISKNEKKIKKIIDYYKSNMNRDHVITRKIIMPKYPLQSREKALIAFFILLMISMLTLFIPLSIL